MLSRMKDVFNFKGRLFANFFMNIPVLYLKLTGFPESHWTVVKADPSLQL